MHKTDIDPTLNSQPTSSVRFITVEIANKAGHLRKKVI